MFIYFNMRIKLTDAKEIFMYPEGANKPLTRDYILENWDALNDQTKSTIKSNLNLPSVA